MKCFVAANLTSSIEQAVLGLLPCWRWMHKNKLAAFAHDLHVKTGDMALRKNDIIRRIASNIRDQLSEWIDLSFLPGIAADFEKRHPHFRQGRKLSLPVFAG